MKLVNNAKSILQTDIISNSNSFLITEGEGAIFKYEIDGLTTNEFTIFAEQIENGIVIKREPIRVKRDGDVFTILERKVQNCVGNDSATPKVREQRKYNFTASITQISIYMSEDDVDEINANTTEIAINKLDILDNTSSINANAEAIANLANAQGSFGDSGIINISTTPQNIDFSLIAQSSNTDLFFIDEVDNEIDLLENGNYNFSTNMTFGFTSNNVSETVTIRGKKVSDDTEIYSRSIILVGNTNDVEITHTATLIVVGPGEILEAPGGIYFTIESTGNDIDVLSFDSITSLGGTVSGGEAKVEKTFIKGLIPAETLSDGVYLYRKGIEANGEEGSKIYQDNINGDLGLYSGTTNGYENPKNESSGTDLEVYGNNIYGGVIQHNQNKINKIELKGYSVGIGTFDFKICPFDGGGNLDTNNPVLEKTGINFTEIPNSKQNFNIDFIETTILPNTDYGFLLINSSGDINNKIILDGTTTATIYEDVTQYFTNQTAGIIIGTITGITGNYKTRFNLDTYGQSSGYVGSIDFIQNGIVIGSVPTGDGSWQNQILDINIDFSLGDIEIKLISNSSNNTYSKNLLVEILGLLNSTTGIGGVGTPITGGIYNKLFSSNEITPINLINKGIFESGDNTLPDNTIIYLNTFGELKTINENGSIKIGKTINENGEILLDKLGGGGFQESTNISNNVTYTAETDGIVFGSGYGGTASNDFYIEGFLDNSVVSHNGLNNGYKNWASITFSVRKGQTYKILCNKTLVYGYFTPLI